jgi:hypothetical protein
MIRTSLVIAILAISALAGYVLPSPERALVSVGIITCSVIGWQSWETRRSVLATLRPKLIIRGIVLVPIEKVEGAWQVECQMSNIGGSKARIVESNLAIKTIERTEGNCLLFRPTTLAAIGWAMS